MPMTRTAWWPTHRENLGAPWLSTRLSSRPAARVDPLRAASTSSSMVIASTCSLDVAVTVSSRSTSG